jgi:MoaD family protein
MKVNLYATLRQVVGGKTVEIPLHDGATVRDLVEELTSRYPDLRPMLLDEKDNLHRQVHLFVNGRDAFYLPAALATPLTSTDTIDIFPPVGGGMDLGGLPPGREDGDLIPRLNGRRQAARVG